MLLLGLAAGTGLLHAEYQGASAQALLPSLRSRDSTTASGSTSSRGSGTGSKRLAVPAHHEELLQALVGMRQLAALHDSTVTETTKQMGCISLAVIKASGARFSDAYSTGAAANASRTSACAKDAVRGGELIPWQLALPLLLTQVELLALAPPCLTEQLSLLQQQLKIMVLTFDQLQMFTDMRHWHGGWPPNWPTMDDVRSQVQLCVESVWLQIGPVLLSLCCRGSGEAEEGDEEQIPCWAQNSAGEPLIASPRELFETFGQLLMRTLALQGGWETWG